MMNSIVDNLKEFLENEAKTGSMDFGCVTPQYVFRMWGGTVAFEEIEKALPAAMSCCLNVGLCNEGGD